jgi:hypothetical protein
MLTGKPNAEDENQGAPENKSNAWWQRKVHRLRNLGFYEDKTEIQSRVGGSIRVAVERSGCNLAIS